LQRLAIAEGVPRTGRPAHTLTSESPGTNADLPPADHTNVLTEWQAADPLTPPPVRPASESSDSPAPEENDAPLAEPVREVARIGWPEFNHNGGAIFFGTRTTNRRELYLTIGDGGSADDQNLQIGFRSQPAYGHGTGSEAITPKPVRQRSDPHRGLGQGLPLRPARRHSGHDPGRR
jgi:hypothetical protein